MSDPNASHRDKYIFIAQFLSLSLIWILVTIIVVWIVGLIRLSVELHDVPGASVGISIVAIPVFIALAAVLTYVFIGLQKDRHRSSNTTEEN